MIFYLFRHSRKYKIIDYSPIIIIRINFFMPSQTLLSLINQIHVQRVRKNSGDSQSSSTSWTHQEQLKFFELLQLYGADFSIIHSHFPSKSRKQIRRKYSQLEYHIERKMQRAEQRKLEQKRKNYFDEQVLELNVIQWLKKPNIAESYSSQESF